MRNTHNRKALVTKLTFSLALFALLTTTVFGMWALIPLDELVEESDLIVTGTLHSATEDSQGLGRGYIRVENIVAGNAVSLDKRPLAIGDNLKIEWADDWACAMGMHMGRRNQIGVWLLDVEKDGSVSAAYPGKFESMYQFAEIRRLLRKSKAKKSLAVDVCLY